MITVKGTLSAIRICPECGSGLIKDDPEKEMICPCGWVWAAQEVVQISAGIQGQAKVQ